MDTYEIIMIGYFVSMVLLVLIGVISDLHISKKSNNAIDNPSIKKYICCALALVIYYLVDKLRKSEEE